MLGKRSASLCLNDAKKALRSLTGDLEIRPLIFIHRDLDFLTVQVLRQLNNLL